MASVTQSIVRWRVAVCGLLSLGVLLVVDAPARAELYSLTDLGTLGGANSGAYGINDSGQVVGDSDTTGGLTHAFLYSNGAMTDLGTLGVVNSGAFSINNAGQVVGVSQVAFLYSNGTMTILGTLGGVQGSQAFGINNLGQVVGESSTASLGVSHAFLYRNGSMLDLNNLLVSNGTGLTLVSANAINDLGQIVGYGVNSLGHDEAFLLTPVPLPGAALLFGSGLLAPLCWQKTRASSKSPAVQSINYNKGKL